MYINQNYIDKEGNEKKYTVQSLPSICYGLKRVLKEQQFPHILTSELFALSQELFKDACHKLKSEGFGSIHHYPEIQPSGKF